MEDLKVFNEKTQEWVDYVLWDRDRINDPTCSWVQIGISCSVNRRSLWVRYVYVQSQEKYHHVMIELCSGREGDDSFFQLKKDEHPNIFESLNEITLDVLWALET